MSKNAEYEYKIIALGDSGVGKTSILKRYAHGIFDKDTLSTIGIAFAEKDLILKSGEKVKLKLVDTGGQEKYHSLTKSYYKNAQGVLFVFAHNDKETFEHIINWIESFDENSNSREIPKFLIGNKNDLGKFDEKESFNSFIKEHNILRYISTSAKDNINISEIFKEMAEIIDSKYKKLDSQFKTQILIKKKDKNSGCTFCSPDFS